MTQKQDRALKFMDEVKHALTHKLPEKQRSEFAVKIEHYKSEIRSEPEKNFPGIADRFTKYVKPLQTSHVPEATQDEVKASLHRLDLAINGRR